MLPRFLLAAAVAVVLCTQSIGQEIPFAAIVDSAFGEQQEAIGELIELQVKDGDLSLFRRWTLKIDRETVNETPESRLEAAIQRDVDRGVPEDFARRRAERKAEQDRLHGAKEKRGASYFMKRIHSNLGGGGTSSSGMNGTRTLSFRGRDYTMTMRIDGEYLQMKLAENNVDGFEIQVVESPEDGLFLFRYNSFDTIVNFVQRKGMAKLSYCAGDEAKVLSGTNYEELLKSHSDPMNAYLIGLWKELGISEPVSLRKPEAMTAAIEILQSIQEDEMKVFGLMESLGSDSLTARKEAASELRTGFYKWKHWVDNTADKFEYDKISQEHLDKARKGSPGTSAQDYARSLDLTDAKTLVGILELANDEQRNVL